MVVQIGVYTVDLLSIVLSPEYGAEALKVGAVYLMFRKDIKSLSNQVMKLAKSTDKRVSRIEKHLGIEDNSLEDETLKGE